MEDRDLIINQIRQRLEILYQIVEDLQNGEDPGENYYTKAQINALLLGKVDVVAGKGLSTNDYTNADKAAVASIADISYNLGVLESVVDGLFDPLDETIAQGGEVSSAQKADIREQKPISLNGNVYYFVEDNGTSYIYCSYDDTNSQLLIAAIGKSNWLVNFNSESLGGGVTGVKGNAESTYRTGNVNITKANIGLGNVDNTSDMDKPLSTAAKTYIDDANEVQDRALAELYGADANQQLEINYAINTGAKNLLENIRTTTTTRGITFTVNEDGSVTVNGTNDGTGASVLNINTQSTLVLDNGEYVLSGCPAGGSETGYMMDITRSPGSSLKDIGNGISFRIGGDYTVNEFRIVISRNVTVNNLTFYPMIRNADIRNSTFEPYAPTNRELYESIQTDVVSHELTVPAGSILTYADSLPAGFYIARQGSSVGTDKPISNGAFAYLIFVFSAGTAQITAFEAVISGATAKPDIFTILKNNGSWGSWYKFEGTQVASVQSVSSSLMLNREEITPLETSEIEERGEINGTTTDWQNE